MWFLLGLVSLGTMVAWQVRLRWRRPWQGEKRTPGFDEAQQRFLKRKDAIIGIEIAYPVPTCFRFDLKRESRADRFFKWIGLSVEHQFGEQEFDRLVYVASDDRHLKHSMAQGPELRRAVTALFRSAPIDCKVRRVSCASGWLRMELHRTNLFSRKDDAARLDACAAVVLPHLREIAKSLCSAPAAGEAHHRDPYLFRSIVLLAISSSLAVNGTLFLLRPHFFEDAFLVDIGHIAGLAVLSGAAILGLLLLANMWLLGRSARGHLILLELLLVGFFGAVASSAAELRDANIEWDRGPAQQLNPRVTSKTIQHSRKGGPTYQLHVVDWNNPGTTRKIKVSRSFYDSVRPGQHLVVHQHPGRLGARWARIHGAGAT